MQHDIRAIRAFVCKFSSPIVTFTEKSIEKCRELLGIRKGHVASGMNADSKVSFRRFRWGVVGAVSSNLGETARCGGAEENLWVW